MVGLDKLERIENETLAFLPGSDQLPRRLVAFGTKSAGRPIARSRALAGGLDTRRSPSIDSLDRFKLGDGAKRAEAQRSFTIEPC